jgi:hypothetical protein
MLVLSGAATTIYFKEYALVVGTKQNSQATRQEGQEVRQADKTVGSAFFLFMRVLDLDSQY